MINGVVALAGGEEDKMEDVGGLSIVDEALADIVLVKKPEMEEW